MNEDIMKIMVQYKILNEGELFCTNLEFNLDDEKNSKFIGDPGKKGEDSVMAINAKLKELQEKYSVEKKELISSRGYNSLNFAKAIYFAAYYNSENASF